MKGYHTIQINFRGGIISPGDLQNILNLASDAGVEQVSFGLRQQLLIDVAENLALKLAEGIKGLGMDCETAADKYPNIVSSYPAEEIFINNTWLSEGVYKDILDDLDYVPGLKINISNSNQSFTPLLTGNINWVASPAAPHFWHLFVRFPKTNSIFEWNEMVYTNDIARLSKDLELMIHNAPDIFYGNANAGGEYLFSLIRKEQYITKTAEAAVALPAFNLPYYEGLHRYNNKYWLGVYRRNELFSVAFLKELCGLCLETRIGQLCSTPWKSVIVKGIAEKDKQQWSNLLDKYEINMRHAANELNFQVQDNDYNARKLKNYLVRKLNTWDTRTFGICIGIKTKSKSEIFSSVLIRRKPLVKLWGKEFFHLYDILCAKDFNPNERTDRVFISNIAKYHLASELRRCILWFYKSRFAKESKLLKKTSVKEHKTGITVASLYQCPHCLSIYDSFYGDPDSGVSAGTPFEQLPEGYCCPLCQAPKSDFKKTEPVQPRMIPAQ